MGSGGKKETKFVPETKEQGLPILFGGSQEALRNSFNSEKYKKEENG